MFERPHGWALKVLAAAFAVTSVWGFVPMLHGSADAATGDPWVKVGYKDGPADIPNTWGSLADMPLPAGRYWLSAKLYFTAGVADGGAWCRLEGGGAYDESHEFVPGAYSPGTIALSAVATLASKGTVTLSCQDFNGGVQANWIKFTALRVNTLKVAELT